MVFTKEQIIKFIEELIIEPRKNCAKWSKITDQTATLRIGYPGQHLASLVTGVKGEKTGARGNDLSDGSEVKSCSRVDQLDKCEDCDSPVLRREEKCGNCDSTNKDRKKINSILMPANILKKDEFKTILDSAKEQEVISCLIDESSYDAFEEAVNDDADLDEIQELFYGIDENLREHLELRDTDRISTSKTKYGRRTHT